MAKIFAKRFYNSKEWKKCKASYIKSVNGLCERCERPGYIVHHKKGLTPNNINNPNITLNHNNLEYLCLDCHNAEHDFNREKRSATKKGYKFNDKGELIPST
ncbi:HNH endonuclease [Clostridium beijerinckii]|uniref:HNH endonuclease n=1 Tax=Clostridium beijerinckii TaxID=1520 RepID=UPI000479A3B0|nr:HNH endonuclease [Clostridium beijerinckii]